MLRVSKAAANLAMQMLARQSVLVRKQRSGTFIGHAIDSAGETTDSQTMESRLEAICVVLSPDRFIPATQVAAGIHDELFGMDVHFSFLPDERPVDFIRERVVSDRVAGRRIGYLLVSCSQEVYRFFAEQDVPAAVIGNVYRDSHSLPSINGDALKAGRLLVDYLLEQGHRKIALLTFSHWRPGDNHFYEGISAGLAAAKLSHDALVMRSLPNNPKEFSYEAVALMGDSTPPTAMICRTRAGADAIAKAAASAGLAVPKDLAVVFGWGTEYSARDDESSHKGDCPFPHVRVCPSFGRHAALATDAIRRISEGENLDGKRVALPVELITPE